MTGTFPNVFRVTPKTLFITNGTINRRGKMRIAVFVEFFPPNFGSDRRIYEIMTRLSKKHEIHFVVFPPFRVLAKKVSSPQRRFHFQGKENIIIGNGVVAHYVPISAALIKLWARSYLLAYVLTMFSLFFNTLKSVARIRPAKIVLNYPSVYTGILGLIVGKAFLRRPVLLDFDDLIAQYTSQLLGIRPESVMAKTFVQVQDFIARNSDKIVVPTDYIKEYTSKLGVTDERIAVISNGVDTDVFDPKKYDGQAKSELRQGGGKICAYCGRLDSWAGANVILQLSKTFALKSLNTLFLIIGSGETKRPLAKNVISVGAVSYKEVPRMLALADVVLVPFPDNEVSRAASPLKLFEGMAMGKAIVASNVDGIREVVSDRENGILVLPDDITEWERGVAELLNDPLMARQLGENARDVVRERYDWEELARRYEGILAE
jgi:glycosyltransferase involved in cell wall biosynthesis